MNNTHSIAKNTIIQVAGKTISALLGLAAVAIMTRALGVEQFGWYATSAGFLQFVGILCDFGFIVTTAKMLSEPTFEKQKLLNNFFTWRLLTAVIFNGVAVAVIWLFPYHTIVKIATAILAASFVANILNQVFIGFYQTKLKMATVMIGEIFGRVVLVAGMALLAYGYRQFLPMMGVVAISAWVYTIYLWAKSDGVKLEIDKTIAGAIYKKMWPTALAVIFNAFYLQGDRVILPLYAPIADVAFYGAAYRVLDITSQIAFLTMGVMLPLLTFSYSRGLKEEFKKYYQLSFDLMLLVLIPIVIGTFVLATPIMRIVAGQEFSNAGKMLALLSWSSIGVCFGMTFGQIALSIDKQRQSLWIFLGNAIICVIAYFIFIPRYGAYGAAWVTIFSEFFSGIALFLFCAFHLRQFPKFINLFKIALASATMGCTLYLIQPLNIIISILLGAIIYGLCAIVLNIVSIKTIKEALTRNQIA